MERTRNLLFKKLERHKAFQKDRKQNMKRKLLFKKLLSKNIESKKIESKS